LGFAFFEMAILKDGTDEYEVRIKRYPDKTYFDEYVTLSEREEVKARKCDRYIVGEEGVTYSIEVTLKAGFNFGDFTCVRASVCLASQYRYQDEIGHVTIRKRPGDEYRPTTSDITSSIEYANTKLDGKPMLGARFTFRNLVVGQ